MSRRGTLAAAAALLLAGAGTAAAQPAKGTILGASGPDAIAGQYIVVLPDTTSAGVASTVDDLRDTYGGQVRFTYRHALRGYAARMTERQARRLATDDRVGYVQQVHRVRLADTQPDPPSWGTDRVDQPGLPLDKAYTYPANGGEGVTAYVLDTGGRFTHEDLAGRFSSGPDFVDNDDDSADCHGHGTHVAGTVGGTKYGVAKKAKLVALRVIDCGGSGDDAVLIKAIDWVTGNGAKPAVVNMSLQEYGDQAIKDAVKRSTEAGITHVTAAGNNNKDACTSLPGSAPEAINVGNSDESDRRNSTSNYGTCLDIYAPGTNIVSASHSSDTGSATMTGTSMASPQVAGAAALYLGANPDATPAQVVEALVGNGTKDRVTYPGSGSPNVLLYTAFIAAAG